MKELRISFQHLLTILFTSSSSEEGAVGRNQREKARPQERMEEFLGKDGSHLNEFDHLFLL